MGDYVSIRNKRLSPEQQAQNDHEVALEFALLKDMQESLSKEVAAFMASNKIGVVKLTEMLQTSSRQTNRILRGEANITLATIASVACLMGKTAKIVFE